MKKFAFILAAVLLLSGCTKVEDVDYEPMSLALPKKGTYFCLAKKKLFVERFQLNTCVPVLRKNFTEGKSGCLVQVIEKYNKIIKYSCFGPDVDSVIKEIHKKYPKEDI